MHDQGLISNEVSAEQQKVLLAQNLGAENAAAAAPIPPVASDATPVPTPKASANLWRYLVAVVLIVIGAVWIASRFAPAIPWADRADTTARALIAKNATSVAKEIQAILHPGGKDPAITSTSVVKGNDRIVVDVIVSWSSGTETHNQTDVVWEVSKAANLSAKVRSDTALIDPLTRSSKEATLDEYFRTKVYPAFYSSMNP